MAKEQMENGANLENALESLDDMANGNDNAQGTEQGKEPSSTAEMRSKQQEAKDNKKLAEQLSTPQISDSALVTALKKAFGYGRKALHLEIATSLAKFAAEGAHSPSKATRGQIIRLYETAGFDVSDASTPDYKAAWRRMDAAAKLYEKIGKFVVFDAMGGKNDSEGLAALTEYLAKEYNFRGLNSVFAAAGAPVTQTNTPERRAARAAEQAQTPMQNAPAPQPQASNEGVSTKAGGEPGTAEPQGHIAAGGTNEQGQPLTKDGTIDKRVKTGDTPSLATQEARGEISKEDADAQAGKQPEQPQGEQQQPQAEASAEDRATAGRLADRMGNDNRTGDRRQARRASDAPNALVFTTDHTHVALPHDITYDEVMELVQKLVVFATEMKTDEEGAKQRHSRAAFQAEQAGGSNRRNNDRRNMAHH